MLKCSHQASGTTCYRISYKNIPARIHKSPQRSSYRLAPDPELRNGSYADLRQAYVKLPHEDCPQITKFEGEAGSLDSGTAKIVIGLTLIIMNTPKTCMYVGRNNDIIVSC